MTDELSLPRLAWNNASSQHLSGQRKRMRLSSPPVSSDPPVFSSDDDPSLASADNYTQERRKRKYRGPWYQQGLALEAGDSQDQDSNRRSRRIFERKFDSGIFMGSDGTDMSDGDALELEGPSRLPFRTNEGKKQSPEDLAQQHIARCLETGVEAIDLSSQGLTKLSNETVRPLSSFTRVPDVADNVFTKLEPKLKLFLAQNELTTLPAELFKLGNLTALSLRANRLYELPPGIGNLTRLKELNLSQNGLRYLPYEILELFSPTARIQSLHLHPNIFYEPIFSAGETVEEPEVQYKIGLSRPARSPRRADLTSKFRRRECHEPWNIVYQGRTEVRFFDIGGKLVKGPKFPEPGPDQRGSVPIQLEIANEEDTPEPPSSRGGISHAPSLVEVALLACGRSPQLPQLGSWLPDDCPDYMREALLLVEDKKESGGSKCTICKRNFIIKRTEWIEYWEIGKIVSEASAASPLRQMERTALESKVPLIRRGCSWFCLPEKVAV